MKAMTAEQWDMFTERAAILEHEGGLDRKAATLKAFELCLPVDYQECMKIAEEIPEGETALYEYLEGLIAKPETAIEKVTMNAETKNDFAHSNTPERPPIPRYEGIEAIQYLTTNGVPIKDFYKPGADADVKTYSTATPIEQGKRYKAFIRGRFLCLDLDRGHKDGGDGVANLYSRFERLGKPRALLPPYLKDIDGGSFPFYTKTPSGGYHLFFKYPGLYVTGTLAKGVEIKTLQVSVGWKDGKPYVLHGHMSAAPLLYDFIEKRLPKPRSPAEPHFTPLGKNKEKFEGATAWGKIVEWTDADGKGSAGRNEWAYSAALHAKTHNWNQSDTLGALQRESRIEGLPETEIISAVNSAWRKQ